MSASSPEETSNSSLRRGHQHRHRKLSHQHQQTSSPRVDRIAATFNRQHGKRRSRSQVVDWTRSGLLNSPPDKIQNRHVKVVAGSSGSMSSTGHVRGGGGGTGDVNQAESKRNLRKLIKRLPLIKRTSTLNGVDRGLLSRFSKSDINLDELDVLADCVDVDFENGRLITIQVDEESTIGELLSPYIDDPSRPMQYIDFSSERCGPWDAPAVNFKGRRISQGRQPWMYWFAYYTHLAGPPSKLGDQFVDQCMAEWLNPSQLTSAVHSDLLQLKPELESAISSNEKLTVKEQNYQLAILEFFTTEVKYLKTLKLVLDITDQVRVYANYCIKFPNCQKKTQFIEANNVIFYYFLEWISSEHPKQRCLLIELLQAPCKRTTQYRLMLENIRKYTTDPIERGRIDLMLASLHEFAVRISTEVTQVTYQDQINRLFAELDLETSYGYLPEDYYSQAPSQNCTEYRNFLLEDIDLPEPILLRSPAINPLLDSICTKDNFVYRQGHVDDDKGIDRPIDGNGSPQQQPVVMPTRVSSCLRLTRVSHPNPSLAGVTFNLAVGGRALQLHGRFIRKVPRLIVRHGRMKIRNEQNRIKDVVCWLFTDHLLLLKPSKRSHSDKLTFLCPPIRLDKIFLRESGSQGNFLCFIQDDFNLINNGFLFACDYIQGRKWFTSMVDAKYHFQRLMEPEVLYATNWKGSFDSSTNLISPPSSSVTITSGQISSGLYSPPPPGDRNDCVRKYTVSNKTQPPQHYEGIQGQHSRRWQLIHQPRLDSVKPSPDIINGQRECVFSFTDLPSSSQSCNRQSANFETRIDNFEWTKPIHRSMSAEPRFDSDRSPPCLYDDQNERSSYTNGSYTSSSREVPLSSSVENGKRIIYLNSVDKRRKYRERSDGNSKVIKILDLTNNQQNSF